MSIKPPVDDSVIHEVLRATLGDAPIRISPLTGGSVARAFSIVADNARYVLRFNQDSLDANFEKEAFIAATFGSDLVPIPEIISHGRFGELRYCLSRWVAGSRLDQLSAPDLIQILPTIADTLAAVHNSNISSFAGFGLIDGSGRGFYADWPASLVQVREEERADGFFGKWHTLFDSTFLSRDAFDYIFRRMETLLRFLPEGRRLLHGNFGFGNVLVTGSTVTAVLDWLEAGYGDFAYDAAWLDYWNAAVNFSKRLRPIYGARDFDVDNWDHRVTCYQCRIALDSMRFFAKAGDEHAYHFTTKRIADVLAAFDHRVH